MVRMMESWVDDQLNMHQAQNPGYELAQSTIHLIYDLLDHVKRLVLHTQSCSISNRISKRSPCDVPVLTV